MATRANHLCKYITKEVSLLYLMATRANHLCKYITKEVSLLYQLIIYVNI